MIKYFLALLLFSLFSLPASSQVKPGEGKRSIYFICPPCNLPCDTLLFDKPGICPYCGMKLYPAYSDYKRKIGEHQDEIDKKVAVVLFPGVEIIDFAGPWEVLGASGMTVFSVSATDEIISTSMGLHIKPDYSFKNMPEADIILVPGGNVDTGDTTYVNWIKRKSLKSEHTMSVCTGAFFLGAAGLLDEVKSTTHYSDIEALHKLSPSSKVLDTVRYVDNGRIITSGGLTSGMDAAFHLVSLYIGKAEAKKLANSLEYRWNEEGQFVRGKLADRFLLGFLNALTPFDYTMSEYDGDETKWIVNLNVHTDLNKEDLTELLTYQLEKVEGWNAAHRNMEWSFEDKGKYWTATMDIKSIDKGKYTIVISVQTI